MIFKIILIYFTTYCVLPGITRYTTEPVAPKTYFQNPEISFQIREEANSEEDVEFLNSFRRDNRNPFLIRGDGPLKITVKNPNENNLYNDIVNITIYDTQAGSLINGSECDSASLRTYCVMVKNISHNVENSWELTFNRRGGSNPTINKMIKFCLRHSSLNLKVRWKTSKANTWNDLSVQPSYVSIKEFDAFGCILLSGNERLTLECTDEAKYIYEQNKLMYWNTYNVSNPGVSGVNIATYYTDIKEGNDDLFVDCIRTTPEETTILRVFYIFKLHKHRGPHQPNLNNERCKHYVYNLKLDTPSYTESDIDTGTDNPGLPERDDDDKYKHDLDQESNVASFNKTEIIESGTSSWKDPTKLVLFILVIILFLLLTIFLLYIYFYRRRHKNLRVILKNELNKSVDDLHRHSYVPDHSYCYINKADTVEFHTDSINSHSRADNARTCVMLNNPLYRTSEVYEEPSIARVNAAGLSAFERVHGDDGRDGSIEEYSYAYGGLCKGQTDQHQQYNLNEYANSFVGNSKNCSTKQNDNKLNNITINEQENKGFADKNIKNKTRIVTYMNTNEVRNNCNNYMNTINNTNNI